MPAHPGRPHQLASAAAQTRPSTANSHWYVGCMHHVISMQPSRLVFVRHAHVADNDAAGTCSAPRRCASRSGCAGTRHSPQPGSCGSSRSKCSAPLWQRNLAHSDDEFRWPGGESYLEFRGRVLGVVQRLAAAHRGQRIAVVTHAGVISQVMGVLQGASPARWDLWRAANCSATEIRWRREAGTVVCFDWRPAAAAHQSAPVVVP
jgi:Histidine phosphatase superfamily (branch 1)